MLVQEAGEEQIRHVIEKHVVRKVMPEFSNEYKVVSELENTLKIVTQFLGSYYELLQAFHAK